MSAKRFTFARLLQLRASENGGGPVAVELIDRQARALEGYRRIVPVGKSQNAARLLVVQTRDERLRDRSSGPPPARGAPTAREARAERVRGA